MGKGLDYDALFPGRFLKAGLFKGKDVTLTITKVRLEDLPQEKGGERPRGILSFSETKLELVLNRTNGEAIKAMFGRDTGEWVSRKVTFYPATLGDCDFADIAVRVRGSPELAEPLEFELRLPRKRPRAVTLVPTGNGQQARTNGATNVPQQRPAAAARPAPADPPDEGFPLDGEPPSAALQADPDFS